MTQLHEANRGRQASAPTRRRQSEAHPRRGTRPPWTGRAWEPWEDSLLDTLPDAEMARRTGRTLEAIRKRRDKLPARKSGERGNV
jgi:hypothetical protein